MSAAAVLALKRRALKAKQEGDIEAAKLYLSNAKQVEQLNTDDDPVACKRLAAILKTIGDVNGAKEFLLRSKQLERQRASDQSSANVSPTTTEPKPAVSSNPSDDPPSSKKYKDPVNAAMDQANLEELSNEITFTDNELLDVATMQDMVSAGMEIASADEYSARARQWKVQALLAKQKGDIQTAKRCLLRSKQFESAIQTLFFGQKSPLETADDNHEDYSLLDELTMGNSSRQQDDGFFEQLFGTSSTQVTLDDLDDLDPSMLRDMIDSGMQVPDVEETYSMAREKKGEALVFKQSGDLVSAKCALQESKRLEGRANQLALASMLAAIESGEVDNNDMDPDAMLEAMLRASEGVPEPPSKAASASVPSEPLKTSHEYKVLAVQHKKAGNLQEAGVALRLYKQVLAKENKEKAAQDLQRCKVDLQEEILMALDQTCKAAFYQQFVDKSMGKAQLEAWRLYVQECRAKLSMLEKSGKPVDLHRTKKTNMKQICCNDLSFIGTTLMSTEERIEVSLLEVFDLFSNKQLRRMFNVATDFTGPIEMPEADSIRVLVTVQLPPSSDAPDEIVAFSFEPKSQQAGRFVFDTSQFVNAERGSSRFAKLLMRRLVRKRIVLDVFYVSVKKGMFSKSSEETMLGSAIIELKDLLQVNVIAGDFPLLDSSRRHEVGGRARIAVRSGAPFTFTAPKTEPDEDLVAGATNDAPVPAVDIRPYSPFLLMD